MLLAGGPLPALVEQRVNSAHDLIGVFEHRVLRPLSREQEDVSRRCFGVMAAKVFSSTSSTASCSTSGAIAVKSTARSSSLPSGLSGMSTGRAEPSRDGANCSPEKAC